MLIMRDPIDLKGARNGDQRRLEELIDLCSDYEKEIEDEQHKINSQPDFDLCTSHQFGAISFYTNSKWSPMNTLQPNRYAN
jgi:hypothetical protein